MIKKIFIVVSVLVITSCCSANADDLNSFFLSGTHESCAGGKPRTCINPQCGANSAYSSLQCNPNGALNETCETYFPTSELINYLVSNGIDVPEEDSRKTIEKNLQLLTNTCVYEEEEEEIGGGDHCEDYRDVDDYADTPSPCYIIPAREYCDVSVRIYNSCENAEICGTIDGTCRSIFIGLDERKLASIDVSNSFQVTLANTLYVLEKKFQNNKLNTSQVMMFIEKLATVVSVGETQLERLTQIWSELTNE